MHVCACVACAFGRSCGWLFLHVRVFVCLFVCLVVRLIGWLCGCSLDCVCLLVWLHSCCVRMRGRLVVRVLVCVVGWLCGCVRVLRLCVCVCCLVGCL